MKKSLFASLLFRSVRLNEVKICSTLPYIQDTMLHVLNVTILLVQWCYLYSSMPCRTHTLLRLLVGFFFLTYNIHFTFPLIVLNILEPTLGSFRKLSELEFCKLQMQRKGTYLEVGSSASTGKNIHTHLWYFSFIEKNPSSMYLTFLRSW